ncbi:MAG TPA: methyltransferase domain-containing protein [Caulobacteraceae bacterium]
MRTDLDISAGRAAFGEDPAAYRDARPPYPEALYARLVDRTGLRPGMAVFEIGPGPGLATARLLELGADPLLAIEPDPRLADYLRAALPDKRLTIINSTLEAAEIPEARFDLGAAATSFHWLDQPTALAKVKGALKPGGWWAMWWTNFGAEGAPDPFQDATRHLFKGTPRTPAHGRRGGPSFAMDHAARLADLAGAGFEGAEMDFWPWTITLETSRLVALYATFSPIQALAMDHRAAFLEGLAEIADRDFGGAVERSFSSVLYTARRPI